MTKNQQLIVDNCNEFEPLEDASGGLCLDGEHKGKTISYGTCQSCLANNGKEIKLIKEKIKPTKCKTCRGL